MMAEVILKTKDMFKYHEKDDDYELWNRITEFMDGEKALVVSDFEKKDKFMFMALTDHEKDKELHYMMEQDSITGCYINDREGFDKAWKSGEYDRDVWFCLDPENID